MAHHQNQDLQVGQIVTVRAPVTLSHDHYLKPGDIGIVTARHGEYAELTHRWRWAVHDEELLCGYGVYWMHWRGSCRMADKELIRVAETDNNALKEAYQRV